MRKKCMSRKKFEKDQKPEEINHWQINEERNKNCKSENIENVSF